MGRLEAAGAYDKKSILGKHAEDFVFQLIEKTKGVRYRHGEAREEGSDIVIIGLDGIAYGIEIKAIRGFLTRDNAGLFKCGELGFEILSKDREQPGSLYQWIFPGTWNIQNEERPAVRPKRTHCVLYDNDQERKHPFCVVTFDTPSLFDFLHGAGKEWGWNILSQSEWSLDRLRAICDMDNKTEIQLPAAGQYIIKGSSKEETTGYCWYVPLNKIISAADKVVMVGDPPPIVQHHNENYERLHPIPGGDAGFQALQQARYNYLSGHSKGASITNADLEEARAQVSKYKDDKIPGDKKILQW